MLPLIAGFILLIIVFAINKLFYAPDPGRDNYTFDYGKHNQVPEALAADSIPFYHYYEPTKNRRKRPNRLYFSFRAKLKRKRK